MLILLVLGRSGGIPEPMAIVQKGEDWKQGKAIQLLANPGEIRGFLFGGKQNHEI